MELIKAADAYLNATKSRSLILEGIRARFNEEISDVSSRGEMVALFLWSDFNADITSFSDGGFIEELLNEIINAGYETSFCYNSPNAYDPCGIVICWAQEAEKEIDKFFEAIEGNYYKGE